MTSFDRLGEQLAREQDALLARRNAQAEVRERLAMLESNVGSDDALSLRPLWMWSGAGALSLALAVVGLIALRAPHGQSLSVRLAATGEPLAIGRFVEAPSATQVGLHFSDGSHIEVAERGRARVVGLKSSGADVLLESGLIHVKVHHRQGSSWHIGAGPFGVHVTGTRFDVRWKPEDDAFELTLYEGQVEVTGCVFGEGIPVQAGQTVRASCRSEHFDVSSATSANGETASAAGTESSNTASPSDAAQPASAVPSATAQAAAPQVQGRVTETTAVATEVAQATPARPLGATADASEQPYQEAEWLSLARAGRYAQALRLARSLGFERECQRAHADELSLLANVARYGQDSDSEALALRLLRERFRGTKRAAQAAFALGRLEFDNHGAYAEAAEWFRIYLSEAPRGDLSREASGRLLEATQRAGDISAARELALQYLADYPQGPHAELARTLMR